MYVYHGNWGISHDQRRVDVDSSENLVLVLFLLPRLGVGLLHDLEVVALDGLDQGAWLCLRLRLRLRM